MIKTLRKSAKTEDDAIKLALDEIGLDRDDVSVQIIERAKAGFLGIGSSPAVIEISYEAPDEPAPKVKPETKPDNIKPEITPAAPTKPEKQTYSPAPEPKKAPEARETPKPARDEPKAVPAASKSDPETKQAVAERSRVFVEGLIQHFGMAANVTAEVREGDEIVVFVETEDAGGLIGRRGDTLDAIASITNLVIKREFNHYFRINVDTEGYRERREHTLVSMAERAAQRVIKTRHSIALDPMNAFERHIVHSALQDMEGISTHSVGSEPNRKVVVTLSGNGDSGDNSAPQSGGRYRQNDRPHEARRNDINRNGFRRDDSRRTRPPEAPRPSPAPIDEYSATQEPSSYKEWH